MTTLNPELFLAIEGAMGNAVTGEWAKSLASVLGELQDLLSTGRWGAAHTLIDQLRFDNAVSEVREQMEELSVSALLFGAAHAAGSYDNTSFVNGSQELPLGLQQAIDQFDIHMQYTVAEEMRWALHTLATRLEEAAKTTQLAKFDATTMVAPLYVMRPLVNSAQLVQWAMAQGLPSILEQHDLHVTVCYSKEALPWGPIPGDVPEIIALGGERTIEKFGKAIVLTLRSAELEDRHAEFRDFGASHDFDPYRAHITLSYSGDDFDISSIEPYDDELIFGPEQYREIVEGWGGKAKEVKLAKAELDLADMLNAAVMDNRELVDITASMTTSRLINFGFLSEAVTMGITTYVVNEVLDDRTCPVCRMMHGKTFKVVDEYSKLMTALSTSDPQELKSIAPWPKQSKAGVAALEGMSNEELQLAGYGSPPYHPRCRGMLDNEGTVLEPMQDKLSPSIKLLQGLMNVKDEPTLIIDGKGLPVAAIVLDATELMDLALEVTNKKRRSQIIALIEAGQLSEAKQLLENT